MTTVLNISTKEYAGGELCALLAACTDELLKSVPTQAIAIHLKAGDEQAPLLFSMRERDNGDLIFVAHRNPLESLPND